MLVKHLSVLRGREAATISAYLEDAGFVDEAVARLRANRVWDRAEAAEFLGRARSRKGVPALVAALDDDSEDVRTVAARSLAGIRDPATVEALASTLGCPSRWTVSMVAEDLMEMGPQAVPALLDMLHSDTHATAVAAVKILGEIRDPRATVSVVILLRSSENVNMRAQAAAALGKLGGLEARTALETALRDPAWQVRSQAAKALGRLAAPGTAPLLARAIFDSSWWVRVNSAEALAELGRDGWEELRRLTQAPDRFVREQCVGVMQQYDLTGAKEGATTRAADAGRSQ
jgi:HEAT repeat protein